MTEFFYFDEEAFERDQAERRWHENNRQISLRLEALNGILTKIKQAEPDNLLYPDAFNVYQRICEKRDGLSGSLDGDVYIEDLNFPQDTFIQALDSTIALMKPFVNDANGYIDLNARAAIYAEQVSKIKWSGIGNVVAGAFTMLAAAALLAGAVLAIVFTAGLALVPIAYVGIAMGAAFGAATSLMVGTLGSYGFLAGGVKKLQVSSDMQKLEAKAKAYLSDPQHTDHETDKCLSRPSIG